MADKEMDRLKPAIHPTYSRVLCAHLKQEGFSDADIFSGTRLAWQELLSEHRYLSLEQLSRLIRRALLLTAEPWIGLKIGANTPVSAHGALGYAVVSAPDMRTLLSVVARFVGVRLQLVQLKFEERDGWGQLRLHENVDLGDCREFLLGALLGTYFQMTDDEKFLIHHDFSLEKVSSLTYDNALDLIALGFDKKRTKIISDIRHIEALYRLSVRIAKHINFSVVRAVFGFEDYHFQLSLWDPEKSDKYIDQPENWAASENHLRQIMDDLGVPYIEAVGEAAFYGPKVDIQFTTLLGREESMSTIQLDFAAKGRFELTYMDETGVENGEVFVIHRAPLSTHERFVAFLIEHWAGNFPTWLSPVQVQVITISEKHKQHAARVAEVLEQAGVRVRVDDSDSTIGRKIRLHRTLRPAYMVIIGDEESESGTVSIRARSGGQRNGVALDEFVADIFAEITNRSTELGIVPPE